MRPKRRKRAVLMKRVNLQHDRCWVRLITATCSDQIEIITASGRESGGDSATVIGGSGESIVAFLMSSAWRFPQLLATLVIPPKSLPLFPPFSLRMWPWLQPLLCSLSPSFSLRMWPWPQTLLRSKCLAVPSVSPQLGTGGIPSLEAHKLAYSKDGVAVVLVSYTNTNTPSRAIVQLLVIGVPASCYVKHSSEALARAAYAQALAMGNVQEI
jgi:hypothetical protein